EGGIVAEVLVFLGIALVAVWCVRGLRAGAKGGWGSCAVAVSASLLAAALHGAVDFVWYIPAYGLTIAVLCGLAAAVPRSTPGGRTVAAPRWATALLAAGCLALFALWLPTAWHQANAAVLWTRFQQSPDGEHASVADRNTRTNDTTLVDAALAQR